jgi:hypothetical protein
MNVRPAEDRDHDAIWKIMPVIRAGETYALPRDMSREDALAYWFAADREFSSPRTRARSALMGEQGAGSQIAAT